jgi:hypothetical protein
MNEDELNERNLLEILRNKRDYEYEPVLGASSQFDDDLLEEYSKLMRKLEMEDFDNSSEMPEFYNDRQPDLKSLQAVREDSPEAVEYNEMLRKLAEEDD